MYQVNARPYLKLPPFFLAVVLLIAAAALFPSCAETTDTDMKNDMSISGKKTNNADLIRNPVSAGAQADTVNVPQFSFDHTTYDFGDIPDDRIVSHVFSFQNTGKTPLVIAHVRGNCGCTVPQWPKSPVPPGGKGEIEVRFDPSGKTGQQNKPVTITANTYPNTTNLFITANIKAAAQ